MVGARFRSFLLLLPLGLVSAAWGSTTPAPEVQSAQLGFQVYSSSYIPAYKGPLTEITRQTVPHRELLDPLIVRFAENTSTARRIDLARLRVLGLTDPLEPHLRSAFYSPGTPDWMGVCNQWSAASLNRGVAALIEGNEGIACDGALLTRGELKELSTAFYSLWAGDEIYGERFGGPMGIQGGQGDGPEAMSIRKYAGLDDLPAHVFHDQVLTHLRRNEGLIMDIDPGLPVWNQPIFAMTAVMSEIAPEQIVSNPAPYPFSIYEAVDPEEKPVLEKLTDFDRLLDLIVTGKNAEDQKALLAQLQSSFHVTYDPKDPHSLSRIRLRLAKDVLGPRLIRGRVRISPSFSIKTVRSKVNYGKEVPYGVSSDTFRTASYDYVLIQNRADGTNQASFWVSPPDKRPDYLMAGGHMSLPESEKEDPEKLSDLGDLALLIHRCTPVSEVVRFFDKLDQALSSPEAAAAARVDLVKSYAGLRHVINRDELARRLLQHPQLGLSEADFR